MNFVDEGELPSPVTDGRIPRSILLLPACEFSFMRWVRFFLDIYSGLLLINCC